MTELLPTPTSRDHKGRNQRDDTTCLPGALLPTPAVNDMGRGKTVEQWDEWTDAMRAKHGNGNGNGPSLEIEAQRLLPTPSAADGTGGHVNRSGDRADEYLLPGIASHGSFGPYTAAIQRWEHVIGRPAPSATEISPRWIADKRHRFTDSSMPVGMRGSLHRFLRPERRLSPKFAEWLMGLPDGWVTDPALGVPRAAQLKALGNGIVPAQMALALRLLGVAS